MLLWQNACVLQSDVLFNQDVQALKYYLFSIWAVIQLFLAFMDWVYRGQLTAAPVSIVIKATFVPMSNHIYVTKKKNVEKPYSAKS